MLQQITAPTAVGQCQEPPASRVTGMLTVAGDMAYFTTPTATYDVIASSPQVKNELRGKRGSFLAELTGKPYPRQTGGTGFDTTAIAIQGPMQHHMGTYSRPHGPGSMWMLTVDGTTYELHPKTDRAKLMLDQAGQLNIGSVGGVINGNAIEVWEVSMPMFKQKAPSTMQSADPSQQASSFERVGQTRQ